VTTTPGRFRGGDAPDAPAFLFDIDRCTGCSACELACSTENDLGWGVSWRQVVTVNEERRPRAPSFHLSLACNHCEEAPCVRECPTLALGRDPVTGTVQVDEGRCIGCAYCAWVCPYDAPRFHGDAGVMSKCTMCDHRLVDGREPACVEACPTGALGFGGGTMSEGSAYVTSVPGFPDTPARPRIRFRPRREGVRPPESTWELPEDVLRSFAAARPAEGRRAITLRGELPLWLFTTLVSMLAGWVVAAALGGPAVRPLPFAVLAAAAMAVSTLHLGVKRRAWRAVANVRRSRLSREVAGFGLFVGSVAALLFWQERGAGVLPWVGAGAGLVALFLIDRVYDPVRAAGARPIHSADALLTGPAFAAVLLQATAAFAVLGGVKLVLYARRWSVRREPGDDAGEGRNARVRRALAVARVALGLAAPPILWLLWPQGPVQGYALAALLFVAGELIDRGELYAELRATRPGQA
jgi:DMSO reductase iron-sulfur subunit